MTAGKSKYWIAFVLWFLIWPPVQAGLLMYSGISDRVALEDSLTGNLLLAFACFDVALILRYYPADRKWGTMPVLWSAGLAGLVVLLMKPILSAFFSDQPSLLELYRQLLPLRFVFSFIVIGAFVLLDRLIYYMNMREMENKKKLELEKSGKDAELAFLRQQLQPHFLFNTLNSISALMNSKPAEAKKMIQQLSDFLRGTVKRDDHQFVDLASELNQLQLYLDIEKVRFGHRLAVSVETGEGCSNMVVPPLLLQPLVENAIKFGLYDTTDAVEIRIRAVKDKDVLKVTIENPFDAQTARSDKGTGFGLSSVKRRLYLLFGRNDLLQTSFHDGIFCVTVNLPEQR